MAKNIDKIDVICQHSADGTIIPLRVRVADEEGINHIYNIKEYRNLSMNGAYMSADGIYVTNDIIVFECSIVVFGTKKSIRLYYRVSKSRWTMAI